MTWIKRNLIFVITIVVGLGLAGYCGYLFYAATGDTAKAKDEYNTAESSLTQLRQAKPFPTKENIQAAQADAVRVKEFLAEFRKPFSGFPTPPKVDDRKFKEYLQASVAKFGLDATNAGIGLNPGYAFSFSQQMDKLNYDSECIGPWMQEIEEIRAILHILYAAKVNFLERIKRPAVSPCDMGGEDFTPFGIVTNQNGVVTPYEVDFRAFSTEIANVLTGIAASSNCLIVKTIYVSKSLVPLPADLTSVEPAPVPVARPYYRQPPPMSQYPNPLDPYGGRRDRRMMEENRYNRPQSMMPGPAAPVVPAGPETILREKPLFVTIYIDLIKLKSAPTNAPAARTRTVGR